MLDAVSPFGVARYPPVYYGKRRKHPVEVQKTKYEQLEETTDSLQTISEEAWDIESPKGELSLEECSSPLSPEKQSHEEECPTKSNPVGSSLRNKGEEVGSDQGQPRKREMVELRPNRASQVPEQLKDSRNLPCSVLHISNSIKKTRQRPLSLEADVQEWLLFSKVLCGCIVFNGLISLCIISSNHWHLIS